MVTELPEQMDELRMVIQAQQRIILELRCLIDGVEEHEQAMLNHISDFYCPRFVTPEKDIETVFSLIKGKLVQSRQK